MEREKMHHKTDKLSTPAPDDFPEVGGDPEGLPQLTKKKRVVAPDPEKVREAERRGEGTARSGRDTVKK